MEKKRPKTKLRSDDEIVRVDSKTWYIRDYMIYNSDRLGFVCDCKAFMFDDTKPCKHIERIKSHIGTVK